MGATGRNKQDPPEFQCLFLQVVWKKDFIEKSTAAWFLEFEVDTLYDVLNKVCVQHLSTTYVPMRRRQGGFLASTHRAHPCTRRFFTVEMHHQGVDQAYPHQRELHLQVFKNNTLVANIVVQLVKMFIIVRFPPHTLIPSRCFYCRCISNTVS